MKALDEIVMIIEGIALKTGVSFERVVQFARELGLFRKDEIIE